MLLTSSVTVETSLALWAQLSEVLEKIPQAVYAQPIPILYQASIGQHTRHLIEFFQCIVQQLPSGLVCYDARQRELSLERSPQAAVAALRKLGEWAQDYDGDWDMPLFLKIYPDANDAAFYQKTPSFLQREWLYAIDHAIHHLALFKVGLHLLLPDFELPAHFGVAPATVHYKKGQ